MCVCVYFVPDDPDSRETAQDEKQMLEPIDAVKDKRRLKVKRMGSKNKLEGKGMKIERQENPIIGRFVKKFSNYKSSFKRSETANVVRK
jgi:hypothetical protein